MHQLLLRIVCIAAATAGVALAQGTYVPETVSDVPPDPEIERKAFKVTDGFEVNLFAADPLLAKPIQMNFDAQGRLWVASGAMYPQIKPGETPTDKVLVLEDVDGDGKAEKSTVFADGLLIPTGVEPGDGGAYVANSTELIHLADTDNDGKADARRVVLSGFGTEDTHHILHTFRWGHDGRLWMDQSIYIHSHVETPWGTKRFMGSGIWRFRPENYQFDVYARGMVNPWGHAWDKFGQSFSTDGAGGEGIYYSFPGSAFQSAKAWDGITDMPRILKGMNPGSPKYCGLEVVSGRHLPDDWQGNLITNDFRANRVVRYQLVDNPNGTFTTKQLPDVITSTDVAFRPIDVKMGPDGAIYIADWYNPIINHGEVDFRDKRRDKTHGRIWRLTAKNRPLVKRPTLVGAPVDSLLDQLKSPEGWTRHHAKLVMRTSGAAKVVPALGEWVKKLDAGDANAQQQRLEALWVYQTLDTPEPELLAALLKSELPQVRSAATRVVPDWRDRLPNVMELLSARVKDEHPRVRMEAVRALARIPSAEAFELATAVLDKPADEQVDYALWTTANEMRSIWMPAFRAGKLAFGGDTRRLAFALQAVKSPEAAGVLATQLRDGKIPAASQGEMFDIIATVGASSEDLAVVYTIATGGESDPATAALALAALEKARRANKATPAGADFAKLRTLMAAKDDRLRTAAIRYAGALGAADYRDELLNVAGAADTPADVRLAATTALAEAGEASKALLVDLAGSGRAFEVRQAAVAALSSIDLKAAAVRAAELIGTAGDGQDPSVVAAALVRREGGGEALAAALANVPVRRDAATLALRAANSTGRDAPALVQRLRDAAGLGSTTTSLTPEQMTETIQEVLAKGDAARGEAVFRRTDTGCFQCHGLGGAGGQLGPDLRAIGASSPVDYLIDSMLDPNKAVKDGYQSVVVATKKGEVFSGVKVSQDDKQVILRDATHDAIVIPVDSVRRERAGGSLMPAGLADSLTRGEFLDLIRFLSELGKPGKYGPDNAPLVRRWRVLDPKVAATLAGDALPKSDLADTAWMPAYSKVAGVLPSDAFTQGAKSQATAYVQGAIDVTSPGRVGLLLGNPEGLTMWVDGKPVQATEGVELELDRGPHTLTFKVDLAERGVEGLRVEIRDVQGSSAHAQPVGGR